MRQGALDGRRVTVVLKGYPRLSETFIAQELEGLERQGARLRLVSLRRPTDPCRHPVHERIQAEVGYLPEYLYQEPLRVLRALASVWRRPGFWPMLRQWWRDVRRDPTANRGRRLGQALVLAAELPADQQLIYAHFIHTPGSVARYAAMLTGVPLAISAHAKDIYTTPDWELREKLADARWTVTCTAANAAHLRQLTDRPESVHLVHHGLDIAHFTAAEDGGQMALPARPFRLLTVSRAVPKKGLDTILRALSRLPGDLDWRWDHVGGGEQLPALRRLADDLGVSGRITWHGPQPQARVLALYREAHLFVLASRITGSGDRDGLPNVLMEAASQTVPTLATDISAIAEFVTDGETGRLVNPDDPEALAVALVALADDPARLAAMGQAARQRLEQRFTFDRCILPLLELMAEEAPRDGVIEPSRAEVAA